MMKIFFSYTSDTKQVQGDVWCTFHLVANYVYCVLWIGLNFS